MSAARRMWVLGMVLAGCVTAPSAAAASPSLFTLAGTESPRLHLEWSQGGPRSGIASDEDIDPWLLAGLPTGAVALVDGRRLYRVAGGRLSLWPGIDFAPVGFTEGGSLATTPTGDAVLGVDTDETREIWRVAADGTGAKLTDTARASAAPIAPDDLHVTHDGSILIAEFDLNRIVRLAPGGALEAVAGTGVRGSPVDGQAASTTAVAAPFAVDEDARGSVLFAARTHTRLGWTDTVWRVDANGRLRWMGGGGRITLRARPCSDRSGDARSVSFADLRDIAALPGGAIALSDASGIYELRRDGRLTLLACANPEDLRADGRDVYSDGARRTWARIDHPEQLAVTSDGSLLAICCGQQRAIIVRRARARGPLGVAIAPQTLTEVYRGRVVVNATDPARVTLTAARRSLRDALSPSETIVSTITRRVRSGATTFKLPRPLASGEYVLHAVARRSDGAIASARLLVLGQPALPVALVRQLLVIWGYLHVSPNDFEGTMTWASHSCRPLSPRSVRCGFDIWSTADETRAEGDHLYATVGLRPSGMLKVTMQDRRAPSRQPDISLIEP